jgi:transketolase
VTLVGNGGGYAYGVMGPSHHALEDYGILASLDGMRIFIPAFSDDLLSIVDKRLNSTYPAYLRLGRDEKPKNWTPPPYNAWRRLMEGSGPVVVAAGPLAGGWLEPLFNLEFSRRPRFWVLTEFPLETAPPPEKFLDDLRSADRLIVAEEHFAHGGIGEALARFLLLKGLVPKRFIHLSAKGYPSGFYGSQDFHRTESGLNLTTLLKEME